MASLAPDLPLLLGDDLISSAEEADHPLDIGLPFMYQNDLYLLTPQHNIWRCHNEVILTDCRPPTVCAVRFQCSLTFPALAPIASISRRTDVSLPSHYEQRNQVWDFWRELMAVRTLVLKKPLAVIVRGRHLWTFLVARAYIGAVAGVRSGTMRRGSTAHHIAAPLAVHRLCWQGPVMPCSPEQGRTSNG